jgi:ATP-dependent helicase HrpA
VSPPRERRRRDRRDTVKPTSPPPPGDERVANGLAGLADLVQAIEGPRRSLFQRRLDGLQRATARGGHAGRAVAAIRRDLERFEAGRTARLGIPLRIDYPAELPVSAARADLAAAIRDHQVVVVCGATGSGKTTQLPKICLELGRGVDGAIAHTQPRRVAARSVAARIAEEVGTELGRGVGYAVRFTDRSSPGTRVRLMTDGILLAETARDPDLLAYDTIIIDEAHERSLNIDFLLGYLKRLLPRRPDLKVIVTSATIDPERFSEHFHGAPILTIEGRLHPVDIRYRPIARDESDGEDEAMLAGIVDAIREIDRGGLAILEPSGLPDILVFLPGEREIRDAADAIGVAGFADTEVLPLFARLSNEQQDRVFSPGATRRIVLATNVAETSLTVPRIRGVIDTGLARIARYSPRRRVQRLPIEAVARASADQRAGRCGRVAPGICIRLCDAESFEKRPLFPEPEIQRSNLASVILRMAHLGLGDPEKFPFVQSPSGKLVRDGYETLLELGAVDRRNELTPLGRELALLPVDPRLGRMILASIDEACLAEVLVITAALTVPDPRERGGEGERGGSLAHAGFRDPESDFLSFLRMWRAWREAANEKGSSALRTWSRRHDLSFVRLREWQDVHDQLAELSREILNARSGRRRRKGGREEGDQRGRDGLKIPEVRRNPPAGAVHRAILSGLVANVGRRTEDGDYRGLRGGTFQIFPGSVLRRQEPPWIMAAEIVETSRRWARTCAKIRGDWIERVAPHLVRRSHFEPHFVPETGFVSAWERVSCGELDTTERRRVPYAPIDATAARDVFIQQALVAEQLPIEASFVTENRALREKLETLSDRGREVGLVADDSRMFAFYDARLPSDVHNVTAFEAWRRQAERRDPRVLRMRERDLRPDEAGRLDASAYPDRTQVGGVEIALHYRYEPGHDADGVTATIPLELLGRLEPTRFEWLVPGLLLDKIDALVRSLPKRIRTRFMPIRETAIGASEHLRFGEGALLPALAGYLATVGGIEISASDFRTDILEPHHVMRFELVDAEGRVLETTRRYADLLASHRDLAREAFEASVSISTNGGRDEAARLAAIRDRDDWDFGEVPIQVRVRRGTDGISGHPAVSDEGHSIRIRVTDDATTAALIHRRGVRRLLALQVADALRHHLDHLPGLDRLIMIASPLESASVFIRELGDLAVAVAIERGGGDERLVRTRDREAFVELDDMVRRDLWPSLERAVDLVEPILTARNDLLLMLDEPAPATWSMARDDEREHISALVTPGFAAEVPPARLAEFPRYIEAARRRLDRLRGSGTERDRVRREEFEGWRRLHADRVGRLAALGRLDPRLEAFGWQLEEYRVHLFAQELGTATKVSPSVLKTAWRDLGG